MTDSRDPTFEAYTGLCLTMPNGKTVRGKVILFPDGLALLELLGTFQATGLKRDFTPLFEKFLAVTGLVQADFQGLQIGELCGAIERFLSHRRTPSIPSSPEPAIASPPAGAAG